MPDFGWEETLDLSTRTSESQRGGLPRAVGLVREAQRGVKDCFPPGKVWGAQSFRSGNQKPLPLRGRVKCRSSSCSKCKKWEEPFSSCGVAKHRPSGLLSGQSAAGQLGGLQPQPAPPPAWGKVGPAPLLWPWAVCLKAETSGLLHPRICLRMVPPPPEPTPDQYPRGIVPSRS